jgi:ABC-type uncharacterized transport system involved in gliding motility auxiliary subunit
MYRHRNVIGWAGLTLIIFGGVMYGILYTSGWLAFLPLLTGLALSVISLISNFRGTKEEGLRRRARFGFGAGVSIIFLAAILILLQTLSSRHHARLDTTVDRRYSLSPQTLKIIGGLESDVYFTCFMKQSAPERQKLEDLLKEFSDRSKRIQFTFVDPDRDPVTARRYELRSPWNIVVESGEMEERIKEYTESKLLNAVIKVTRSRKIIVCFVAGHGEKSIEDTGKNGLSGLREAIEAEHYEIRELLTMGEERIPGDCDILVIGGPAKDLSPREISAVEAYAAGGGDILFLLDPLYDLPLLVELTARYGVDIGDDVIVDRFGRLLAGNYLTPIVNKYGSHPITDDFRMATIFPQARSVTKKSEVPEGAIVEILCRTGDDAYAETDIEAMYQGKTQFEGGKDVSGPIDIAVVAARVVKAASPDSTGEQTAKLSRIVVFGDSDFADNSSLNLSGNRDLIMNTLGWLAEEEDLIAIRAKDGFTQPVNLSARQGRVVFWLPVVGMPALVGIIGVIVAAAKRKSA